VGADPKPLARVVDQGFYGAVVERDQGACRICGGKYGRSWMSVHHLVGRGQGGDDVPANGVLLCGSGTTGCHGKVEGYMAGARSRLRARLLPAELAYIVEKKSRAWLDRHYPEGRR